MTTSGDLADVAPPAPPAPTGSLLEAEPPARLSLAGTWEQSVDEKHRFAVPIDVRRAFGEKDGAVARAALVGCVTLVPTRVHEARTRKLEDAIEVALEAAGGFLDDTAVEDAEELLRLHNAGTASVMWDGTGRISLRPDLFDHAGLLASTSSQRRFALVAGMGERAEIWEPAAYAAHIAERTAARRARTASART